VYILVKEISHNIWEISTSEGTVFNTRRCYNVEEARIWSKIYMSSWDTNFRIDILAKFYENDE
jgi:hypothetical protein